MPRLDYFNGEYAAGILSKSSHNLLKAWSRLVNEGIVSPQDVWCNFITFGDEPTLDVTNFLRTPEDIVRSSEGLFGCFQSNLLLTSEVISDPTTLTFLESITWTSDEEWDQLRRGYKSDWRSSVQRLYTGFAKNLAYLESIKETRIEEGPWEPFWRKVRAIMSRRFQFDRAGVVERYFQFAGTLIAESIKEGPDWLDMRKVLFYKLYDFSRANWEDRGLSGGGLMNQYTKRDPVIRARFLSVASVGAFLIAISEMVFMASPFAAYFYSAYSPVLTWMESHSFLIWLTDFFVPHLSTPVSAWFGGLLKLPRYLALIGIASFLIHAVYLYWTKFVRKTVATALLYRYVRHPQYLSFAVAGLGLVFFWPRFINLLLFFVMLIGYYTLARSEEERMQRRHGEQYLLYKQRTAMFIPGRIGGRIVDTMLGWLPSPSIRTYVALVLLLAVGLTGSFLVRAASVKNLHYVALPNALLVFLEEPVGVSQSEIESEITRVLADRPVRGGTVPLFYVVSRKDALHHLLIDSGITRNAVTSSKLPDASWYLVGASASYCASAT